MPLIYIKEKKGEKKGMDVNVILQTIIQNLTTVGLCLILFVLFRVSDILFGIAIAKKNKIAFNWKKFFRGIFYTLCAVGGLATLVTGLSMVIPIVNYCGITTDETVNQVLDVINVVAICTLILGVSIITYGKSAFEKFNTFIKT